MNILKLFKGAKFDYDQIKEENVIDDSYVERVAKNNS